MSSPSPDSCLPSPDRESGGEVLVKVENVSKIFCRDLKKSLLYGLQDSARDLFSFGKQRSEVRGQGTGVGERETDPADTPSPSPDSRLLSPEHRALRTGEFLAVDNVSFELKRGECLGLIGHNGAGKTTLLKMLNGLIKPDSGRIEMHGRVGALIALGAGFNPILTGRENIYVNAAILGLSTAETDERMEEILDFADIGEFIDAPVQNYSSGMQVRLGFAVASALRPDIILLDEVLAVGDVAFQAKCFNKLAEMRREGVPFILVSHSMHLISRYCHKVVFMKHGQIEFVGDAEEGIARFLADMKESEQDQSTGPDWSVVQGSGKVAFTGARFSNASGEIIDTLHAGNSLTLIIDYQCCESPPVDPVLDLVISSRGEKVFQQTSKTYGTGYGSLMRRGSFQVHFTSIPFNAPYVEFHFCLMDGKTNEVFDWKRGLRLNIKSDALQTGLVSLETKWMIKK